jgi:polysaccharide biosynthesis protein PelA
MKFLFSCLCLYSGLLLASAQFPWVVYYSDRASAEDFEPYNPIVLDSDTHPPIASLKNQKKEVLGYIDLGEAEEWRSWFAEVKKENLLIRENPNWKGSWLVDIRNPFWKQLVLEKIIPSILAKGFSGLFFDQLDVSLALEEEDPKKYKGMTAAAVDLVLSIRSRFPDAKLMMNRAYAILPQVGQKIDYELAETLYSKYDFTKKQYFILKESDYTWQLDQLNQARKTFPHLVLFSLDYWDPADKKMIKKIYSVERAQCIRPYVSSLALDTVIPEPDEN